MFFLLVSTYLLTIALFSFLCFSFPICLICFVLYSYFSYLSTMFCSFYLFLFLYNFNVVNYFLFFVLLQIRKMGYKKGGGAFLSPSPFQYEPVLSVFCDLTVFYIKSSFRIFCHADIVRNHDDRLVHFRMDHAEYIHYDLC